MTLSVSDCLIAIGVSACLQFPTLWLYSIILTLTTLVVTVGSQLLTIIKSVVFRKFHIQPTPSELTKLPQDHLV